MLPLISLIAFILFVVAAVMAPRPVSVRIAYAGLACLSVGLGALKLIGIG